jgi:arginase family enzyme
MKSRLTLIGAPTSAGAYAPGQEKAPAAFRTHGIVQAIRHAGWEVRDAGDVTGFRWRPDPLRPKAMNLEAVDPITQTHAEKATVASRQLRLIELQEVRHNPEEAIGRAIEWGRSFERLAIHLDADILSFPAFPIAENVRRQDGLTLPELSTILQGIFVAPNLATLTITEINPDHAANQAETFGALISTLANAMARHEQS